MRFLLLTITLFLTYPFKGEVYATSEQLKLLQQKKKEGGSTQSVDTSSLKNTVTGKGNETLKKINQLKDKLKIEGFKKSLGNIQFGSTVEDLNKALKEMESIDSEVNRQALLEAEEGNKEKIKVEVMTKNLELQLNNQEQQINQVTNKEEKLKLEEKHKKLQEELKKDLKEENKEKYLEKLQLTMMPERALACPQLRFMGSKYRLLPWLHERAYFELTPDILAGTVPGGPGPPLLYLHLRIPNAVAPAQSPPWQRSAR